MSEQVENRICSEPKQRKFQNESCKRSSYSDAQCQDNETVLRLIASLNCMIPMVKEINQRTNKTNE
jgi:hypothetical protein